MPPVYQGYPCGYRDLRPYYARGERALTDEMDVDHPLSEREFWTIYRKVPRLTVEVVLVSERGVLLTRRDAEPCRGLWHLPGGTVRFGEPLTDAVARVARGELGISVDRAELLGYIEYPSHYNNNLDSPVGIAFKVTEWTGTIELDDAARAYGWFRELPPLMHDEQREFLLTAVPSTSTGR